MKLLSTRLKINNTLPALTHPLLWVLMMVFFVASAEFVFAQPAATPPAKTKNPEPPDHPLAPALKIARQSRGVVAKIKDYQGILTKRELVKGRMITQQMDIRLRHAPFSVYLKYRQPSAGREILYVKGQNNNQMLAHEGSGISALVGTVSLATNGPKAQMENRHPITMIGMSNMLEAVIAQWEKESQFGEITIQYYPNAKLGNVACEVIESTHPRPRRQFSFQKTRIFFDKATKIPIRVEQYAFPAKPGQPSSLVEEYTYTNIRTNVGMTNMDFSRRNPRYRF